jgi:hypothetical protein
MRIISTFSRLTNEQPTFATIRRVTGFLGVAILSMTAAMAVAQAPAAPAPATESMSTPAGYTAHHSIDIGGRFADQVGSGAMYNTLVNLKSGPRVQGETLELHALPGKKNAPVDNLTIFGSGFGGDPINVVRLNATKGNAYEFSGLFRRDRQYFDYDLLGNPGIPSGNSIPISGSTTPYPWSTVNQSPFMFNTVRRMTDTNLTLLPVSRVTFRFAYSQNIFQGPSMTPSGNAVAGSEVILEEYQRNSTDDFTAAVDWKPVQGTKLTYEEQIDHYKGDSFMTVAPQNLTVQEADGTKVALLASYSTFMPYGYNAAGNFEPYSTGTGATATSGVCNASIANRANILYANPNGLPIIDPACNVIVSYLRSMPTRELFPTEIFRLQSSSIKNLAMNGNIRYTSAKMNMPNYYEIYQGLDAATRELASSGLANAKRKVMAFDYGVVWQATKTVSLSDAVNYSNVQQPGTANLTGGTTVKVATTVGQETINNTTTTTTIATTGAGPGMPGEGGPTIGGPTPDFFGQRLLTNNATITWDAGARTTLSLTYRYRSHFIAEGTPHIGPAIACPSGNAAVECGSVSIGENGGIFTVAVRPTNNWDINGSVEMIYDDNVFTPVAPRQTEHYRVHTLYRPKTWATVSAAYNDLERHNNTNNLGAASGAGPLGHVDHSRVFSLGTELTPNEHYGLDLNYSYSDVYTATNICFQGAASYLPGGAIAPAAATQSGALCVPVAAGHGSNTVLFGPAKDFDDAPTQFVSAAVMLSPNTKVKTNAGYRLSDVNGSRFFTDASDVNGSTVSRYQTPFLNLSYAVHPDLIFKGEYDYYGYGEGGGKSGAQYCNANPALAIGSTTAPVVACSSSSVANTAMSAATPTWGFTAPRNFHANNITLGIHYEF